MGSELQTAIKEGNTIAFCNPRGVNGRITIRSLRASAVGGSCYLLKNEKYSSMTGASADRGVEKPTTSPSLRPVSVTAARNCVCNLRIAAMPKDAELIPPMNPQVTTH